MSIKNFNIEGSISKAAAIGEKRNNRQVSEASDSFTKQCDFRPHSPQYIRKYRWRLESCEIVRRKNNTEQRQIDRIWLVSASIFSDIRIESWRTRRLHGFSFGNKENYCRIEGRKTPRGCMSSQHRFEGEKCTCWSRIRRVAGKPAGVFFSNWVRDM